MIALFLRISRRLASGCVDSKRSKRFVHVHKSSPFVHTARNSRKPALKGERGQAAIFDGIMFLLFAAASVAMVFYFLSGYGVAQDNALRSAYVLAYVQDVGKSLFFVQASSLAYSSGVKATLFDYAAARSEREWVDAESGSACGGTGENCPYFNLGDKSAGCPSLEQFQVASVADLLKKDLGDFNDKKSGCATGRDSTINGQTDLHVTGCTCFDNKFGRKGGNNACGWRGSPPTYTLEYKQTPTVPGKLALRCALKELMKPFHYSGFKYFAFPLIGESNLPAAQPPFSFADPDSWRATNHWAANKDSWTSCEEVVSRGGVSNVMTVSIPFRVPVEDALVRKNNLFDACLLLDRASEEYEENDCDKQKPLELSTSNMEIRICIWPSSKKVV